MPHPPFPSLSQLCADQERAGRRADQEHHQEQLAALRAQVQGATAPQRDTRTDLLDRLASLEGSLRDSYTQMSLIDSLIQTGACLPRLPRLPRLPHLFLPTCMPDTVGYSQLCYGGDASPANSKLTAVSWRPQKG